MYYMKRGQNNPSVEMKRSSLKCNDYQQKKVVNVIEIFEVFEGGNCVYDLSHGK